MKKNVSLMVFVLMLFCGGAVNAGVVFEDHFNSLGKWFLYPGTGETGANQNPSAFIESGLAPEHEPYMRSNYGSMRAEMSEEVTTSFRATWKWLIDDFEFEPQSAMIFFMNAAGNAGYGVRWFGGWESDPGTHAGTIKLVKYKSAGEEYQNDHWFESYNAYRTDIITDKGLVGDSNEPPFAEFELIWEQIPEESDANNLILRVTDATHGVIEFEGNDPNFASFSRIYTHAYGGNAAVYIDDLKVTTVIEPTTCTEAVEGGYGMVGDVSGDCVVGIDDIKAIVNRWLVCNDPEDAACIDTW